MDISYISVNDDMQSVLQYGTPQFPVRSFFDVFSKLLNNKLNWHWHTELELVVVLRGTVRYFLGEQCFLLHPGDGAFISAGTLHGAEPDAHCNDAVMFASVFSPEFIMTPQSLIYLNCVAPYIVNSGFPGCALYRSVSWQQRVLKALMEIKILEETHPPGYELRYHDQICRIWMEIIDNLQGVLTGSRKENLQDICRAKRMLEYIHMHYAGDISVSDIADAANISKSECFRCFKKVIRKRPFEYLTEYRLGKTIKLLAEPGKTIAEIGMACGFNHQSYFGKQFKKFTGRTPNEFRKMAAGNEALPPLIPSVTVQLQSE